MSQAWSNWKRFPNARTGESVEAPIGPGVYEVRHAETGELIAFGHSGNVANSIADLKVDHGGGWKNFFRRETPITFVGNLEYRTCAAASRAEAKITAQRLIGLRQTYWKRRMDLGWAARHSQH
ncbi:MAG: hypothetical protein JO237_03760 [Pseudolabrys sp.]|nr:hypothetical protein [Pseudolabrys sp.]